MQRVENSTAQIRNAWSSIGTAFQVRYNDEDLLITSAHLTTNIHGEARGFYSGGKQYFVVVRDGTLALAEHIIYNPQGSACFNGEDLGFISRESFRDISVLRVLTRDEAIPVLNSIWANGDGGQGDPTRNIPRSPRERMADIVRNTPELRQRIMDAQSPLGTRIGVNEIADAIGEFHLESLELTRPMHPGREPHVTPNGYSLGYFHNYPQYVFGEYERKQNSDGSYYYRMDFSPDNPFTRGFSGGPAFDVDQNGRLVMRGINTGLRHGENIAFMTPIEYVYQGLDIATGRDPHTGLPAQEQINLVQLEVCPVEEGNGPDIWLTPNSTPTMHPVRPHYELDPSETLTGR